MEEIKCEVKITKNQAFELQRFEKFLCEYYAKGNLKFDIDRGKDYLNRTILNIAFGWFHNKNIPFAYVIEFIEEFTNKAIQNN